MPDYIPIFDAIDLPTVQHDRESHVLEFKAYVPFTADEQRVEAAKDLAAFANADGGSIIYGAVEGTGGVLDHYAPFPDVSTAEGFRAQLRDLAKAKCAPPLTIDVRRLEVSAQKSGCATAGSIVIANVFPAPGQATGVELPWNVRQSGKKIETYFFPVRVGDSCGFLNPEQIAMLMIPRLRRVLALLRQIDSSAVVHLHWGSFDPDEKKGVKVTLAEVNELSNFARFAHAATGNPNEDAARPPMIIPLDAVRIVYRCLATWHICADYINRVQPIT